MAQFDKQCISAQDYALRVTGTARETVWSALSKGTPPVELVMDRDELVRLVAWLKKLAGKTVDELQRLSPDQAAQLDKHTACGHTPAGGRCEIWFALDCSTGFVALTFYEIQATMRTPSLDVAGRAELLHFLVSQVLQPRPVVSAQPRFGL